MAHPVSLLFPELTDLLLLSIATNSRKERYNEVPSLYFSVVTAIARLRHAEGSDETKSIVYVAFFGST